MDYTGTLYLCDECSQMYRIHIECETTTEPIAHCPVCGTPTLRVVRSVMDSSLTGTNISTYGAPLRVLMYQMWKQHLADKTRTLPTYSRYVDYVVALVAAHGDDV